MLRLLVAQQNLSLVESARLMAVTYSAMADGIIGCFNAKYTFSFWRPVTAIRNGDIDGNPNTVPDPSWTPLGTTPGHPEYPSAHGCLTGALADALEGYFGTSHVHLTISSVVTDTTHNFSDLRDLKREVFWARIYAGFHYHHSMVQGFLLGHKVAHHITHNYFEPTRKHKEHH
jgi:PAP2 superfamily